MKMNHILVDTRVQILLLLYYYYLNKLCNSLYSSMICISLEVQCPGSDVNLFEIMGK